MSYYTSVLYLILQIVISNAAPANESELQVDPIIIHGTPVRIEQFPFFVGIQVGGYSCGGVIISDRWILTAAHCIHPGTITVFAGGEQMRNSQRFLSRRAIKHPRYTPEPSITYDIGLVELQTPLRFNAKVQAAKLPRGLTSNPNLVFIGRGHDETDQLSTNLMKMDFLRMSPYDSMKNGCGRNEERQLNEHSLFCGTRTDKEGPGVCKGDSGSPVLEGDTVIGVLSYFAFPVGYEHCKYSKFAGFTNVFYFKDWIASHTGQRY